MTVARWKRITAMAALGAAFVIARIFDLLGGVVLTEPTPEMVAYAWVRFGLPSCVSALADVMILLLVWEVARAIPTER